MKPRLFYPVILFGLFVSLCALTGCGAATGDVTGVVTYNGKPLVMGNVAMVGSDGLSRNGLIGPDGRYVVSGVPAGAVKVTVSSPNPSGQPQGRGGAAAKQRENKGRDPQGGRGAQKQEVAPADAELAKQWVAIPDVYTDPTKSNLSTLVKAGENTYNIDLK